MRDHFVVKNFMEKATYPPRKEIIKGNSKITRNKVLEYSPIGMDASMKVSITTTKSMEKDVSSTRMEDWFCMGSGTMIKAHNNDVYLSNIKDIVPIRIIICTSQSMVDHIYCLEASCAVSYQNHPIFLHLFLITLSLAQQPS